MDLPFIDHKKKEIDWSKPIGRTPTSNGFSYFWGHGASLDFPPYVYIKNNHYTSQKITTVSRSELKINSTFRTGPKADNFDPFTTMDTFCDRSAEFIRKQDGSKPFALYVPLTSPHTPILPTGGWKGKSGMGDYADFVMQTDAGVGRILDALDEKGFAKNTIVIFTADNGCSKTANFNNLESHGHLANHIYRGSKSDIWEGGHRVPHLLRWPAKVKAGSKTDRLTVLGDVVATMADIIGVDLKDDEGVDSMSFYPALLGKSDSSKEHRAIVNHSINGTFAIRTKEWKLAFCAGSGGWTAPKDKEAEKAGAPKYQLYNMIDDPRETKNLYESKPEVVQHLTQIGTDFIKQGRSTPGEPQANDTGNEWAQVSWMLP